MYRTVAGRSALEVCNRVCKAVDGMADEPCGEALLSTSAYRLDLFLCSSGHIADALAIFERTKENVDMWTRRNLPLMGIYLVDGSPQGCAAIEDGHYCLTTAGNVVLMEICLPQSCGSNAVARLSGNIKATGVFPSVSSARRTVR